MKHGGVIKHVLIWATEQGWRLFPNNVGMAWAGKVVQTYRSSRQRRTRVNGAVVYTDAPVSAVEIADARPVRYGLAVGSSDLIGYRTLRITRDMVPPEGIRIAQFVSLEGKTPSYDRCTKEQKNWLRRVRDAGGYAGVVRRNGDTIEIEEV